MRPVECDANQARMGPVLTGLFRQTGNGDGIHVHGCQAREQKCRREPFPVHFAVDLVGRLIDAIPFQPSGQLLVAELALPHSVQKQHFGLLLPWSVGRFLWRLVIALRTSHSRPPAFPAAFSFGASMCPRAKIGLIRPIRRLCLSGVPTRLYQPLILTL